MSDDWGDIEDGDTVLPGGGGGYRRSHSKSGGLDREQRLAITIGAGACVLVLIGAGIGFALGRATAPSPPAPAPVVAETTATPEATVTPVAETSTTIEPTDTPVIEATETVEASDTAAPNTPKQLEPDDGDRIATSRTTLRWSKVSDPSNVEYHFEIQTWLGTDKGWDSQTVGPLTKTNYSVRVTSTKRRWRVWAVDGAGNASKKSGWSYFSKKTVPAPSQPSTTTTSD